MAYATAIGKFDLIYLNKTKEHFLYKDWKNICECFDNDYNAVVNMFVEICNEIENTHKNSMNIFSIKPDLLGELYALELLRYEENENYNNIFNDEKFIENFAITAWKENKEGFYEFQIRVMQDYLSEMEEIVKELVIEPSDVEDKIGYAILLFCMTFSTDLEESRKEAVEKLEKLHNDNKGNEEIALEYAKGLFNLTVKQETEGSIKETVEKLEKLNEENKGNEEIAIKCQVFLALSNVS